MNLISDGYLFEKHHSQRIVEIEEKHSLLAMVSTRQQKNSVVLKKTGAFFQQLSQLRKIRIQVSFDMEPFAPDSHGHMA